MRLEQNFLRVLAPFSSALTNSSTQLETVTNGTSCCSHLWIKSLSLNCPAALSKFIRKSGYLFGTVSSSLYIHRRRASPTSWFSSVQSYKIQYNLKLKKVKNILHVPSSVISSHFLSLASQFSALAVKTKRCAGLAPFGSLILRSLLVVVKTW